MYLAHKPIRLFFTMFILFLLLEKACADSLENGQPINIVANSTLFNYKTGVDTFDGDVKVDQGTTHLTADHLVTTKNDHHQLEEAIASGTTQKLAEYNAIPKPNDPLLLAKALIIRYYPLKQLVVLEGNVTVTQGENSFHGPLIIYNIKDQIVSSPASKNGRATMIIQPK